MAQSKDLSDSLRLELKHWEKQFAAVHDGRPPGREDIKQDTVIASKYRAYNKLRDSLADKTKAPRPPSRPKSQRGTADTPLRPRHTASKQQTTPRILLRSPTTQSIIDHENQTPKALRTWVDPTPQKDGRVLGLFDLMSDALTTPGRTSGRHALAPTDANAVEGTPKRHAGNMTFTGTPVTESKHSTTSSKRYLPDVFATPSKRQKIDHESTPTTLQPLQETNTPAFLSRHCNALTAILETNESCTSPPAPLRRRSRSIRATGLTRSLSSMIADMRQAEEDKLDDELDMLREMESHDAQPRRRLLVAGSQVLGPDGSGSFEDDQDVENGVTQDGRPLKIWKKRGQKRQTRRWILRPTSKPKSKTPDDAPSPIIGSGEGDVSRRQLGSDALHTADEPVETDSEEAVNGPDNGYLNHLPLSQDHDHRHSSARSSQAAMPTNGAETRDRTNQSLARKVVKKISAAANANFCRLKIRSSKGAKAATSANAKFGKRR